MSEKLIEVKVTARAGRRIPGYGSRQQGETFSLPSDVAVYVANLDGFETAHKTPVDVDETNLKKPKSKPKSEAKPLAEPAPEVKENDNAL